ncbi:MAG TPA: DUF4410 domain-containing protein [Candidatus Binatia bacterium]|jgi:hypothetical protein|nr:DUF4410 domain-containing protein [Candidatus Binatia bacterium]
MRSLLLATIALTLVGCSTFQRTTVTDTSLPNDATITVVPFGPPTKVLSYDGPTEALGATFAARIADELGKRGRPAQVSTTPAVSATVVRGRLLRIDGGSHAKRFWLGFGAGRATLSAEGTVTRPGSVALATFREDRSASGTAELGFAGDQYLIDKCLDALAEDVASMIDTGHYREVPVDE